jgi:hypothetical protein
VRMGVIVGGGRWIDSWFEKVNHMSSVLNS